MGSWPQCIYHGKQRPKTVVKLNFLTNNKLRSSSKMVYRRNQSTGPQEQAITTDDTIRTKGGGQLMGWEEHWEQGWADQGNAVQVWRESRQERRTQTQDERL